MKSVIEDVSDDDDWGDNDSINLKSSLMSNHQEEMNYYSKTKIIFRFEKLLAYSDSYLDVTEFLEIKYNSNLSV